MVQGYHLDPQNTISDQCYAVVYAPRRKRDRFPESCVEVHSNAGEAMAHASPEANRYAAKMIGPARSSEGFKVFYLVEWLSA